jgi:hypothetical protein
MLPNQDRLANSAGGRHHDDPVETRGRALRRTEHPPVHDMSLAHGDVVAHVVNQASLDSSEDLPDGTRRKWRIICRFAQAKFAAARIAPR